MRTTHNTFICRSRLVCILRRWHTLPSRTFTLHYCNHVLVSPSVIAIISSSLVQYIYIHHLSHHITYTKIIFKTWQKPIIQEPGNDFKSPTKIIVSHATWPKSMTLIWRGTPSWLLLLEIKQNIWYIFLHFHSWSSPDRHRSHPFPCRLWEGTCAILQDTPSLHPEIINE